MEMVKNALNWFEIPVKDFDRAKKFYSAIFDFEMPEFPMGPSRIGILPYDHTKEGVGGAIILEQGREPNGQGTLVYLSGGADLAKVLDRVAKAGGTVIVAKRQVTPEIGYIGLFKDTEGNVVGLHSKA